MSLYLMKIMYDFMKGNQKKNVYLI